MAGAIDLFSGSKSLTGTNLFQVDKSPLNEIFEGVDDVIGKQALNLGANMVAGVEAFVSKVVGALIDIILGIPTEILNQLEPSIVAAFHQVDTFFTNILGFLNFDPLAELFTIEAAAQAFINNVLAETGLLPILDGAGHLGAQYLQLIIDAIAQAFGLAGGLNFAELESELANAVQIAITGWLQAFQLAGVAGPEQFVELLRGLIPAAIPQFNGTAIATTVQGWIDNANGTISYIQTEAQDEISHLIQQADGTVVTAAGLAQHISAAATAAGVSAGQAIASGQQAVDHGIAAIQGDLVQVGQSAQAYGSALTGAFTSWFNSWSGSSVTAAAAPDVAAAAAAAAAAAVYQSQLTSAINSQLPHFYGGSGTSGLNVSIPFTGTLPASFTSASSIAANSAIYTTATASTDQETVSELWNTSMPFASNATGPSRYLFLRSTTSLTSYLYTRHWFEDTPSTQIGVHVEIGCVVAGIQTVLTTDYIDVGSPHYGALIGGFPTWSLEVTGYAILTTGPGGYTLSVTDAVPVSQSGASYRSAGIGSDESSWLTKITNWNFYDSGPTAGPATAFVATSESTASITYTDLTTTTDQVTVNIGPSGMAIVALGAAFTNNGGAVFTYVGFGISGANTVAASDSYALSNNAGSGQYRAAETYLLTGLTVGASTFKMKYRVAGGTGTYVTRRIAVIPL